MRIALPDDVEHGNREADGLACVHFARDVDEHSVAQIDGVIQTEEDAAEAVLAREVFENALASETGPSIFADWRGRIGFARTAAGRIAQRIDIASGKNYEAAVAEAIRDDGGQDGVHRPGQLGVASGTEFAAGEVEDVGAIGKGGDLVALQKVAGDGFDSWLVDQAARYCDDATRFSGLIGGAAAQAGRPRSHLFAPDHPPIALLPPLPATHSPRPFAAH